MYEKVINEIALITLFASLFITIGSYLNNKAEKEMPNKIQEIEFTKNDIIKSKENLDLTAKQLQQYKLKKQELENEYEKISKKYSGISNARIDELKKSMLLLIHQNEKVISLIKQTIDSENKKLHIQNESVDIVNKTIGIMREMEAAPFSIVILLFLWGFGLMIFSQVSEALIYQSKEISLSAAIKIANSPDSNVRNSIISECDSLKQPFKILLKNKVKARLSKNHVSFIEMIARDS